MTTLEARLRTLQPAAMQVVAGSVLEALRTDDPPATDMEIEAASAADRRTVLAAAKQFNLEPADAPEAADPVQLILILAERAPQGKAALEAALRQLDEAPGKLPVFGLGGLEIILLAIAAAIVRPSLEFEHQADGGTRLRVRIEGRDDLEKIIQAVLPSLS